MILGQDQAIQFPTMDLYDSGMMLLYANAVLREYERGLAEQKEFMAKYGDFTSPVEKDVEYWNAHTMQPVIDTINQMVANGIDPTRSPEARALISRKMLAIPYDKLAEIKQTSDIGKLYLKSMANAIEKGTFNEDYEKFRLKGRSLANWDTANDGMWKEAGVGTYQDLNAATKHWYDQMKPGYLYTQDGYDYIGIDPKDVRGVAQQHLPDLTGSYWDYQRYLAEQLAGPDATPEQIQQQLEDNLVAAAAEVYSRPTRVESAETKREQDYLYADKLDASKSARDFWYNVRKAADLDLDGKLSEDEIEHWRQLKGAELASKTGKGGKGSKSGNPGHTHLGEIYTRAISQAVGGDVTEDFGRATSIVTKQSELFSKNVTPKQFMESNVVYDSGGTITDIFKGKTSTKTNVIPLTNVDIDRLHTAGEIANRAYGSKSRYAETNHVRNYNKTGRYKYGMLPTGRIKTVLGKDGRFRTYAEMEIYYIDTKTNLGKDSSGNTKIGDGPVKTAKERYYYDAHLTSVKNDIPTRSVIYSDDGTAHLVSTVGKDSAPVMEIPTKRVDKPAFYDSEKKQFIPKTPENTERIKKQIAKGDYRYKSVDHYYVADMSEVPDLGAFESELFDLQLDPMYELERESMDVNVGKGFSDTASRSTADARIE